MDLAERLDRYIASKSRKPDPFASETDAMRDQLTSGGMSEDQAFDLALAMARERERARDVPEESILGGDMSRLFQQDPTMMERIKRLPAQTLGAGEALASLGSAAALSVPSMVQSLVTGEKDPLGMMKRQMYVPKTEEGMGALTAVGELIPEIPAMPQVQLQALQAIPAGAVAAQAQRGLQGGLRAAQPMLAEGAERILGAQGLMMQAAPSAVARMDAPTSPLGFYDPVHQAALNIQRKQGPGQAFLNELQRSENVNKEFLESSGIAEKLRNSPSITREQVQELAKGAVPEIQEVVKGAKGYNEAKVIAAQDIAETIQAGLGHFDDDYQALLNRWRSSPQGSAEERQAASTLEALLRQAGDVRGVDEYIDAGGAQTVNTKYGQYQLPGGENYREVLLKMPSSKSETTNDIAKRLFNKEMRFLSENEKDQVVQESRRLFETQPKEFRSPHWEEPNVVAHIRMNDRTDADGKKVLFIEEIQSDWAQEGRKKGFAPKDADAQLKAGEKRLAELGEQIRQLSSRMAALDDTQLDEFNRLSTERQRLQDLQTEEIDWGNRLYDARREGVVSAPFVTNTKEWLDLSLKNIIKRAVDEGYDRVAFINGAQSADRYDLSKQIESVSWQLDRSNPNDHRIIISAEQKDDRGPVDFGSRTNSFKPDELSSVVGKELADKILESINNNKKWGILEGLDLEVGGEGMKAFYDKLVPERVNAVLKRFGGGNIGVVKLPGIRETAVPMNALQPGFDITPAMRERFQKPIPYKKGGLVQAFQFGGTVKSIAAGAKAGAKGAAKAAKAAKSEDEKTLPMILERAPAKTKKELQEEAERIGRQIIGEHVTKPGDTANLAGYSKKVAERLKAMEEGRDYVLEQTTPVAPLASMSPAKGSILIGLPGDISIADKELKSLGNLEIGSQQQGGSLYGLPFKDDPEEVAKFWASNYGPANIFQKKVSALGGMYPDQDILGAYMSMGRTGMNFAQHFADANLKAIRSAIRAGNVSQDDIESFNKMIREGWSKKNKKTGEREYFKYPDFAGIENTGEAYAQMMRDPDLRKWFNDRMKIGEETAPRGLPSGVDIEWAISEPALRNLEHSLVGYSVGKMQPGKELIAPVEHATYSHGIPGRAVGRLPGHVTARIAFPDASKVIAETKRPQDFTGTIQKVFPHQVVDQQWQDEVGQYLQYLKRITGKKKGGLVQAFQAGGIVKGAVAGAKAGAKGAAKSVVKTGSSGLDLERLKTTGIEVPEAGFSKEDKAVLRPLYNQGLIRVEERDGKKILVPGRGAWYEFATPEQRTRLDSLQESQGVKDLGLMGPTESLLNSAQASFYDFEIVPGVRNVPIQSLEPLLPGYESAQEMKRIQNLANQIKESKQIEPLFIGVDPTGIPYIMEGQHRIRALKSLGYEDVPARIVVDMDEIEKAVGGTVRLGGLSVLRK